MCGVIWRAAPAKIKRGMCEMKILGSEVLWCVFGTLVQDGLAHMCGVTWELFRQSSKQMCEMKILGSEVLWCRFRVGTHAWCHLFRVVPAKFKTGM